MKKIFFNLMREFYLIIFRPSRYEQIIEDQKEEQAAESTLMLSSRIKLWNLRSRIRYPAYSPGIQSLIMAIMWISSSVLSINLLLWVALKLTGYDYKFGISCMGSAIGAAVCILICVAVGMARELTGVLVRGLLSGLIAGIGSGIALGIGGWITGGAISGITSGISIGLFTGISLGLQGGLVFAATVGLVISLIIVPIGGATSGVLAGGAFLVLYLLVHFRLILYPIDVLLSTILYINVRSQPRKIAKLWRWCPIEWNEVIYLPLPFINRILKLWILHDREQGYNKLVFIATQRTLQARVSQIALLDWLVNDLKVESVSDIAELTEKLKWIKYEDELWPAALNISLPAFDEISRHIAQYSVMHNPYGKEKALDSALKELGSLEHRLIAMRDPFRHEMVRLVTQMRALLTIENEHLEEETSPLIPNPFVFGNPVIENQGNVFTGRQDIINQIEESILGASHIPTLLLHGPRRMGKTSILYQLPKLLGPRFATVLVNCQNPAVTHSTSSLLRYFSRNMVQAFRQRNINNIQPLAASDLEREPFGAFEQWLNDAQEKLRENMQVLLCLDEYERLQYAVEAGWGKALLDYLRHLFQHYPSISLMFTGTHTFAELGPEWTDRFVNARRIRVGFLTPEEAIPLLVKPIPRFNMDYAPGALDGILAATAGQPFLIQAVGFELVQLLNEQRRKQAFPMDVEDAIARVLVSGGEYFANIWADSAIRGREILRAIVMNEIPLPHARAQAWLNNHSVLNKAGGFAVPMFERWVKQTISTDEQAFRPLQPEHS